MSSEPLLVELPPGIPYLSGSYGIAVHEKKERPITIVHNDWDLWFIVEGHETWELRDGRRVTFEKDHFYLLPPYVSVLRTHLRTRMKLWFFHFDFHEIPACAFTTFRDDCLENKNVMIPMSFSKREAPEVWRAYRDLLALNHDLSTGRQKVDSQGKPLKWGCEGMPWCFSRAVLQVVSALGQFALRFGKRKKEGAVLASTMAPHPHLVNFFRQLNMRMEHQWQTAELAGILGLSIRQADRIFRSVTGQSMKQYVMGARLRRATTLLTQHRHGEFLALKEISDSCGYSSVQHFSAHFKKCTGLTPRAYRGRHC